MYNLIHIEAKCDKDKQLAELLTDLCNNELERYILHNRIRQVFGTVQRTDDDGWHFWGTKDL